LAVHLVERKTLEVAANRARMPGKSTCDVKPTPSIGQRRYPSPKASSLASGFIHRAKERCPFPARRRKDPLRRAFRCESGDDVVEEFGAPVQTGHRDPFVVAMEHFGETNAAVALDFDR